MYQERQFVHNSVCSQFLEGLFAILAGCSQFCLSPFNRNSRGNPSFRWLGGGGVKGHKNCEQKFCEQRGVFAFACQYIVSLRRRTSNRTVTQMRHPLLVESMTKLCATIACQYTVDTSRHGDIVLRSRSPHKCHYPLFAYPLFKRAQEKGQF